MQYLAELSHTPTECPLSNKISRDLAKKALASVPALGQKHNVRPIATYHLDPEHRGIVIVDAPSVEAVRDLLFEAGFMHFCDGRIYPVTSLDEFMERAEKLPTAY